MHKLPMTAEGYTNLMKEIESLKKERPSIIAAIAEARAHGDLSENADYDAAREKQGFIEAKIKDLESKLSHAEIVDPAKNKNPSVVGFGSYVELEDEDTGDTVTYRIVSEYEADIARKYISYTSPVARGLMGRSMGDSIEVKTPKGMKYYEIKSVFIQAS